MSVSLRVCHLMKIECYKSICILNVLYFIFSHLGTKFARAEHLGSQFAESGVFRGPICPASLRLNSGYKTQKINPRSFDSFKSSTNPGCLYNLYKKRLMSSIFRALFCQVLFITCLRILSGLFYNINIEVS